MVLTFFLSPWQIPGRFNGSQLRHTHWKGKNVFQPWISPPPHLILLFTAWLPVPLRCPWKTDLNTKTRWSSQACTWILPEHLICAAPRSSAREPGRADPGGNNTRSHSHSINRDHVHADPPIFVSRWWFLCPWLYECLSHKWCKSSYLHIRCCWVTQLDKMESSSFGVALLAFKALMWAL